MEQKIAVGNGCSITLRLKKCLQDAITIYGSKVSEYTSLSICGEINSFDSRPISCQCIDEILARNPLSDTVKRVHAIWKRWHLNDLKAGCCHQIDNRWNERRIDESKPINAYGKFFDGQGVDSCNMLAWVRQDENPKGLLMKPCDVCGYRYGSRWLLEVLPPEVIQEVKFLFGC